MNITNDNNQTSFNGILYCKMGSHVSKGISCCQKGDAKFIKTFNKIAKNNPENLKIDFLENNTKKILVETSETPKLNIFEKLFYIVNSLQNKAIKLKKKGIITSFTYQLSELEFKNIKNDYPYIFKTTLKEFEENVKKLAPKNTGDFLEKFFNA